MGRGVEVMGEGGGGFGNGNSYDLAVRVREYMCASGGRVGEKI